jgi:predicted nucleotidyltransferase component of viral defense system
LTTSREEPPNLRSLTTRIANLARERVRPVKRIQRAIANTVVGQMLPAGVVKGGTAIKVRVGEEASRFTPDLDVSRDRSLTLEDYLDRLDEGLTEGWGGFTGTITRLPAPQPAGVPEEYVTQPFDIRLAYRDRHWLTVRFELGREEVGSTEKVETRLAQDILDLFSAIGLPAPQPLPVLAVEHQIAQKLHACTSVNPKTGANERAHDLVDLQILEQEERIDMTSMNVVATRLFDARRGTPWPPTVRAYEGWDTIYASAADGLDVLQNVHAAVEWANEFIALATRARPA